MVKKAKEATAPGGVYKPKVGDKIICEHKGYKYEARILQIRKDPDSADKNPELQCFVHYQGWNKNWDEWAGLERVFEYNDANIALMREQRSQSKKGAIGGSARKKALASNQQVSDGPPTQRPSTGATAAAAVPASSASAAQQSNMSTASSQGSASESISIDTDQILQFDKEIKIKIPDELRDWLVDDDNNIKNKKLTELPAKTTISTILKDFVSHKRASTKTAGSGSSDKELILTELTLGIRDYFNVMLGSFLLYKFERLQYQLLLKEHGKDVDLTEHYGVIHLIRLFTRIGKPLASSALDQQSIQTIVSYIQELLKFISKQSDLFDLDENYNIALPDYIKNSLK